MTGVLRSVNARPGPGTSCQRSSGAFSAGNKIPIALCEGARQPLLRDEPVRTLEALHLDSIELLAKKLGWLTVVVCNERVRQNALGFKVLPPPR